VNHLMNIVNDAIEQGGYNLKSISVSALAVAKVLLGAPPPELPPMVASDIATETVFQCAYIQSRFWKSIDPKACEPVEGEQSRENLLLLTYGG
jgi:histone deacetylase 6